jgi:hypothetical protein
MDNNKAEFVEAVKEALSRALDERGSVDAVTHRAHHDFVDNLIACSKRRREIFDGVVKYVMGIGVVAAGAFFVGAIGNAVVETIKEVLK